MTQLQIHLRGSLLQRAAGLIDGIDGGEGRGLVGQRIFAQREQLRLFLEEVLVGGQNGRLVLVEDGVHAPGLLRAQADRPGRGLVVPPAADGAELHARARRGGVHGVGEAVRGLRLHRHLHGVRVHVVRHRSLRALHHAARL